MSDPLVVRPQNKTLAVATAAGVGALAIGGFTLSFTALRELAEREFAIAPHLSFIYPLVIDGFIVIATAAAFTMKNRGPRVTWYPWAALVGFGALSVLGNAAHAMDNASATFPEWLSALGASVPAVALLVASHLLVLMIDGKSAARTRVRPKRPTASPMPTQATAVTVRTDSGAAAVTSTSEHPSSEVRRLHAVNQPATTSDLAAQVAAAMATGRPATAAMVAELEGVSERTGRRRLAELRKQNPELFTPTTEIRQETSR